MKVYIEPIGRLINEFSKLPGVGAKTAQRFAYKVVNMSFDEAYKSFCDSYIFKKIKSLMDGRIILIKNIQENSKLALSNNDIISLVKTFNKYFPNTISSLKKDYEGITSNDSKFFILSFMNFNDIEIAVLLGLTYSASNKRSKKIKDIFNITSDLSDFVFQYTKSKF
jgi:hypothetical protein